MAFEPTGDLKVDLQTAILNSMDDQNKSYDNAKPSQRNKVTQFANELGNSIINWVTTQTFTVTDLSATINIPPGQPVLTPVGLGSTAGPIISSADVLDQKKGSATNADARAAMQSLNSEVVLKEEDLIGVDDIEMEVEEA